MNLLQSPRFYESSQTALRQRCWLSFASGFTYASGCIISAKVTYLFSTIWAIMSASQTNLLPTYASPCMRHSPRRIGARNSILINECVAWHYLAFKLRIFNFHKVCTPLTGVYLCRGAPERHQPAPWLPSCSTPGISGSPGKCP